MAGGGYSATEMIPGELTSVRLRDIADVYEGYKTQTSLHYLNGKPSVSIGLQKQSGKLCANSPLGKSKNAGNHR